jgi:hypothetical protein
VAGYHLPLFIVTAVPLLISFLIPVHLIPVRACTFLRVTGYPCPFCGMSRAFQWLSHGHWRQALLQCPASLFFYLVVWGGFVWNGMALLTGRRLYPGRWAAMLRRHWKPVFILVALLVLSNWIYRLWMGFK